MGRRRRRVVRIVKKKLPTVFSCPSCGEEAIKIVMDRGHSQASVHCAACGLKEEVEAAPADQIVDVYCKFTDRFYGASTLQVAKTEQIPAEPVVETQREISAGEEPSLHVASNPPEEQHQADEASEEHAESAEHDANEEEDTQTEDPLT